MRGDNINFTTIIFAIFGILIILIGYIYESRSILAGRWSLANGKAFLDIGYPGRIHEYLDPTKFLFSSAYGRHLLNHSFHLTDWILIIVKLKPLKPPLKVRSLLIERTGIKQSKCKAMHSPEFQMTRGFAQVSSQSPKMDLIVLQFWSIILVIDIST